MHGGGGDGDSAHFWTGFFFFFARSFEAYYTNRRSERIFQLFVRSRAKLKWSRTRTTSGGGQALEKAADALSATSIGHELFNVSNC